MAPTMQSMIVNGPAKWDLSVALFDKKHAGCRRVTFDVMVSQERVTYEMQVNSVQAEDGSGESWNIEGYAKLQEDARGSAIAKHLKDPKNPAFRLESQRVFIYYRTDSRKGYMKFLE